ncbi:MAG TPA: hypothetical protein VHB72_04100 [Candidatus Saccharimonadales bacterium]|nr:hypothetical protein [Candidatus Saccharimonadales bacterium]
MIEKRTIGVAPNGQKKLAHEIEELAKDNEKLRAENTHLQEELNHQHPLKKGGFWRGLAVGLCVIIAALFFVLGNVVFWAGNTLVNTDRYVQTVQPILEDHAVQAAIADYTAGKLFSQVDVTGIIQNALPPKAGFLAPALTSGLRNTTDKTLQSVLASNKFQAVWVNTNRTAHDKLISSIKHSDGNGVISLQDVYDTLGQNLQGTKLSFLAGKSLPQHVGSITVINAPWIPKARFVINSMGWLKPVTLLLVAVFAGTAIWLARRRRATIIGLAAVIGAGMAITLGGVEVVKHYFVLKAPAAYQTAASHAATIVMHHLVVQTLAILCLMITIGVITWISSSYKPAAAARRLLDKWFTTPIHRFIWPHENTATGWLARNRTLFEWAIVGIIAINVLLSEISPKVIIIRALWVIVLVLAAEIIASPRIHSKA